MVQIQNGVYHLQLLIEIISNKFERFDIDIFVSNINAKCDVYVSWFPDPGSFEIDAFTISWSDVNFYAFPSFILLPPVLRKIINDRTEGTIIVPW